MCTTFIAKLVLGIINTVVFLVGLALFLIGILIYAKPELSQDALESLMDSVKSRADDLGVTVDTSDFSVAEVAYSLYVAFIVIGIFLAGVSLLGIFGVKYGLKPVLIVYFIITLVLFLAQVIVVLIIVIDRDVFDKSVKPNLKTTITDYFEGFDSDDPTTLVWNGIMVKLKCCGVDSFEDFAGATKWNRNWDGVTIQSPIACCKTVSTSNYDCATSPDDDNSYWQTGCYTKMFDYVMPGIGTSVATIVLFCQLLILLLTCILLNSIGKVGALA